MDQYNFVFVDVILNFLLNVIYNFRLVKNSEITIRPRELPSPRDGSER